MKLSGRLLELAQLVDKHKNGTILADIGTDHAYLPCYLIEKNIIEKYELIDGHAIIDMNYNIITANEASLSTIEHYHFEEKIEALLGNGLNPILDKDVSMITIAGMGAFLIGDILEENKDYYLKIAANSYQQQFDLYDFYADYLEKMIKAAEEADGTKRAEKMKQQDEISADDLEVRELLLAQAVCRNNAVGKAAAAQSILDANKSAVDAIKKDAGDEYKDDNRYLKLMMRNGELKAYEDQPE